jgi:hypothetical protein
MRLVGVIEFVRWTQDFQSRFAFDVDGVGREEVRLPSSPRSLGERGSFSYRNFRLPIWMW